MPKKSHTAIDWKRVSKEVLISNILDDLEEQELVPAGDMIYQFSARGHTLSQVLLAQFLTHPADVISTYYRSRPLLLSLGFPLCEALAASLARMGGYSDGRDVGVTCNFDNPHGPTVLPMAGDVGSQYTPLVGWAQALAYRRSILKERNLEQAIAVVHGGDGSIASNGFWAALNIATTLKLPVLFYIEDNGYGISVPADLQTPSGNIARNLHSFRNLRLYDVDGTEPGDIAKHLGVAIALLRDNFEPVLLRLKVPRLSGHSIQDTQKYKSASIIRDEQSRDPVPQLKAHVVPHYLSASDWQSIEAAAHTEVQLALQTAKDRPFPKVESLTSHVYFDANAPRSCGDSITQNAASTTRAITEGRAITLLLALRQTLKDELARNDHLLVFGEDVGVKGGVHGVTQGLQKEFGSARVFDTSLSEEGIVGRAVGMAMNGLKPVAEIQFRKYADPATEQMNNCGTLRWRTANRFAAPIVLRMPGGFGGCGDPWHSMSNEVFWAHAPGWQIAMPSNAADAVGLLRFAMRDNNPSVIFEHRALLNSTWAKRPYPGPEYVLPFGKGRIVLQGEQLTLVTWGAMVQRCQEAVEQSTHSVELIDLRSIAPWDKDLVYRSVKKTGACLVVHEDNRTAGFGAEIIASVSEELFSALKTAPVRVAVPDIPLPYNLDLLEAALPSVQRISTAIAQCVL